MTEQIQRAKEKLEDSDFQVIDKYEGDFDSALVFHRCYEKCYINRLSTVIAADSKVYFCHDKAYVSESVVGDLKGRSLKNYGFPRRQKRDIRSLMPRRNATIIVFMMIGMSC